MKKAYQKPEAKKVNFQYDKVVATSGVTCDPGWTLRLTSSNDACPKCTLKPITIGPHGTGP